MDFSVYRGKIRLLRIIGALLLTVAASAVSGGVLNLLMRLELIPLHRIAVCAIAVGVGALAFAVSYLLLRMPAKRLAKKLDNDFSLKERVQTTLEYEGNDEPLYQLQRKDTESVLSKIEPKSLGLSGLPIYVICAVVGIAVLLTSFAFKKQIPEEEPTVDPPFSLTEIQEAAVTELIEYVDSSEMAMPYRGNVVIALTELLGGLREATLMSQRDACLSSAMDAILAETDSSSFALELAEELYARDCAPIKELAKCLNYYTFTVGEEWESFADRLTAVRVAFAHDGVLSETPDFDKISEDTCALLSAAASNISIALTRCGIQTDDALFTALKALADGEMNSFSAIAGSMSDYEAISEMLDAMLAEIDTELFDVILSNKVSTDTGEYALKRLSSIFSCKCPAFERPKLRDSQISGAGGDSGGEGGGQGAIGSGTVYGSDDLVLDPNTDEYVEYGTIISRYYEIVFGKLNGDAYTEEEKAAMEAYFDMLYGTEKD